MAAGFDDDDDEGAPLSPKTGRHEDIMRVKRESDEKGRRSEMKTPEREIGREMTTPEPELDDDGVLSIVTLTPQDLAERRREEAERTGSVIVIDDDDDTVPTRFLTPHDHRPYARYPPGSFVCRFGKYRGWHLRDIPPSYLDWCRDQPEPSQAMKDLIAAADGRPPTYPYTPLKYARDTWHW